MTEQEIKLTPDKIKEIASSVRDVGYYYTEAYINRLVEEIINAQLERVIEWADGDCPHGIKHKTIRRKCFKCWQSFIC